MRLPNIFFRGCLTPFQHSCRRLASTTPQVCIVGSGPSAFYTAQYLLRRHNAVQVDMFEKLPAPFGLVRYGVAPDHPEVKNVINTFTEVAKNRRFSFLGNVAVGKDIRLRELQRAYSIVILAYGASRDRMLNIPGEDLPGVLSAKDFVSWYNGAPELSNFEPDLDCETVAVVGIGNVALDVARILLSSIDRLKTTDIPEPVMALLARNRIRRVVLIGRRGPLQVAFTLKEVRELTNLTSSSSSSVSDLSKVRVRLLPPGVIENTMGAEEQLANLISELPRPRRRLTQFLVDLAKADRSSSITESHKWCDFLFLRSPVRIWPREQPADIVPGENVSAGRSTVGKIELAVNSLQGPICDRQTVSVVRDAPTELLDCGLVVRSIGYQSVQIDPDLPFDQRRGLIQSIDAHGRVAEPLHHPVGADASLLFCTGWAKRGAVGVIVDTALDAKETGKVVLLDLAEAELRADPRVVNKPGSAAIVSILQERGIRPISFADWERVDKVERLAGRALGKPREKLTSIESMLGAAFADIQQHLTVRFSDAAAYSMVYHRY